MTDTSKPELLPCPFCGEEKTLNVWGDHGMGRVYKWTLCECCHAQGPRVRMERDEEVEHTERRANETWNDRVPSYDDLRAQLSSAKAEIERLRGERDAAIEKCAQEIEKIAQLLFEREISDPDSDDFDADAYEEAEYATNLLKGTAAAIRALSNTTPHLDPKDAVIAELGSTAAQDVLAERQRQKDVEGWTPERDDTHTGGQMAGAAACYALTGVAHWACGAAIDTFWPWDKSWWKPTNPRRDLVKAAALLLAEIERLDRLSLAKQGGSDG